jgi:hypothetical protein
LLGAFASWTRSASLRRILFAALAGALMGFGVLGIFSIGLPLIMASLLFSLATINALTRADSPGVVVLVTLTTLAVAPALLLWVAS